MHVYRKLASLVLYLSGFCLLATAVYGDEVASPIPLKGAVNLNVVQIEEALQRMKTLESSIRKNNQALAHQLSRQDLVHAVSPNVVGAVGTLMVIPPMPQPDGLVRMGDLKPISEPVFRELLSDLQRDITETRSYAVAMTNWPVGLDTKVADPWRKTLVAIDDMVKRSNRLVELCSKKKMDRMVLGREVIAIHDECDRLRKELGQVDGIVADYIREKQSGEIAGREKQ